MYINDEKVIFNNYESDIVYISSDIKEINIDYQLSEKNDEKDLIIKKLKNQEK